MSFAARSFTSAVNHLLSREPWARERLVGYAGKRARLMASPFDIVTTVGHDGMLVAAAPDAPPLPDDVTITVTPEAATALLRDGPGAVIKHVRIEGDAEFATTIGKLAEQLRWDPEEDLSRLVGDAAAYRVVGTARSVLDGAMRAGRGLAEAASEYCVDEVGWLVRRSTLDVFGADIARLRDDVARLEKRIERLGTTPVVPPPGKASGAPPAVTR